MIFSTEQADGSTLVRNAETGRTYRFPSFTESIRRMSEDEIYAELAFGSVDTQAYYRELARRGDAHSIKLLEDHR